MEKLKENKIQIILLFLYLIVLVLNLYFNIIPLFLLTTCILLIVAGFIMIYYKDLSTVKKIKLSYNDIIYISVIVLIAILFRFFRYDEEPFGLHPVDKELTDIIFNQLVGNQANPDVFSTLHSTNLAYLTTTYIYLQSLLFSTFGLSLTNIKLMATIPFVLASFSCYMLTLLLTNDKLTAFVSALFLVASSWGVIISISNFMNSVFLCLIILAFTFFIAGIKYKSHALFGLSGIISGLAFYISLDAIYSILIIVLIGIFWKFWKQKEQEGQFNYNLFNVILWFLLIIFPLIFNLFYDKKIEGMIHSIFQYNVINICLKDGTIMPLFLSIKAYVFSLLFVRYKLEPFAVTYTTLLDFILGTLFILGALLAFKDIRYTRNQFLLLWLLTGLVMCILSMIDINSMPDFYKASFILPVISILSSISLIQLVKPIIEVRLLEINKYPYTSRTTIVIIIIMFMLINSYRVFYKYGNRIEIYSKDPFSQELIIINNKQ